MNGRLVADIQDPPAHEPLPMDSESRILQRIQIMVEDRQRTGISQEAIYWYGIGRIHEAKQCGKIKTEQTQKLQRHIVKIIWGNT